jgi:hypothetical protein
VCAPHLLAAQVFFGSANAEQQQQQHWQLH